MPEDSHPGVYVEETGGARTIEGVPTSTAGFVGRARHGPLDPTPVTSVAEFEVLLRDALVEADTTAADREALEAIGAILRKARHSRDVQLNQRNIIVIEDARPHTSRSGAPSARGKSKRRKSKGDT